MAPARPKTRVEPTSSCPMARPRYPMARHPQQALGCLRSAGCRETCGPRQRGRPGPSSRVIPPAMGPCLGHHWGLGGRGTQPGVSAQSLLGVHASAQLRAGTSLLCSLCCGFSCHLLFPQPYVPKDPPVLRVTEGPFFSEVVAYYEHVHQVVRLYNLPGEEGQNRGVGPLG